MAQDMFSRWDQEMDTEGLQKDVEQAAAGGGQRTYKVIPDGDYEVAVMQMELKASKTGGDPMVSIWFKIVSDGDYKGCVLFYNQVITQGFQIHNNNEMLRMMVSEVNDADRPVVEFRTYRQYSDLLMDIFEAVADNFEYGLKYTTNRKNKDFHDFEITEVFVLE